MKVTFESNEAFPPKLGFGTITTSPPARFVIAFSNMNGPFPTSFVPSSSTLSEAPIIVVGIGENTEWLTIAGQSAVGFSIFTVSVNALSSATTDDAGNAPLPVEYAFIPKMKSPWYATSEASFESSARFQPLTNDDGRTASPLENFRPFLNVKTQVFAPSLVVHFEATSPYRFPFASVSVRPSKSIVAVFAPTRVDVRAGSM